jgi:hypothetical protein
MKDSNVFFLGTQTGVRVYTGHDDEWKDAGRHFPASLTVLSEPGWARRGLVGSRSPTVVTATN